MSEPTCCKCGLPVLDGGKTGDDPIHFECYTARAPAPILLTFLYGEIGAQVVSLVECRTTKRTVEEAWEDTLVYLHELKGLEPPDAFNARFNKIHTFLGCPNILDETKPLRAATPEETKVMHGHY
jgi:hypothetical protein